MTLVGKLHSLTFMWLKQTLVLTLPGSVTWCDKGNVIEKPDLICSRNILAMFFSFQVWRLKIQELIRNLEARKCFVFNLFDIDILIKRPIVLFDILLTRKFQIDKLLSLLLLKIVNMIYGYFEDISITRKIKEFSRTIACFSNYAGEYMLVIKMLFKLLCLMSALFSTGIKIICTPKICQCFQIFLLLSLIDILFSSP